MTCRELEGKEYSRSATAPSSNYSTLGGAGYPYPQGISKYSDILIVREYVLTTHSFRHTQRN
jgi:hypothetical protein